MGCDGMSVNRIDINFNGKAFEEVLEKTLKSMNIAGEVLLNQKIVNITPLKTGKLRKSIVVKKARKNSKYMAIVSKGNIAPYNARVHELEPPVNWTTPGTGGKFIENPFKENIKQIFADVLRNEMRP